jgi:hypothetical protein
LDGDSAARRRSHRDIAATDHASIADLSSSDAYRGPNSSDPSADHPHHTPATRNDPATCNNPATCG